MAVSGLDSIPFTLKIRVKIANIAFASKGHVMFRPSDDPYTTCRPRKAMQRHQPQRHSAIQKPRILVISTRLTHLLATSGSILQTVAHPTLDELADDCRKLGA
ncbi:hypothetical protein AWENTII_011697 [Aspergillus wentii]